MNSNATLNTDVLLLAIRYLALIGEAAAGTIATPIGLQDQSVLPQLARIAAEASDRIEHAVQYTLEINPALRPPDQPRLLIDDLRWLRGVLPDVYGLAGRPYALPSDEDIAVLIARCGDGALREDEGWTDS